MGHRGGYKDKLTATLDKDQLKQHEFIQFI